MHAEASQVRVTGRLASEALSCDKLKCCVDACIISLLELEVNGIEFGTPETLFLFLAAMVSARD